MLSYLAKRLVQLAAVVFVISVLAFLLVHLLPGDPSVTILGPFDTPTARAEILRQLGLDKPLPQQYLTWAGNVLHGNLGRSFLTKQSVAHAIAEAFPIDLELVIVSQVIAFALALPLALVASRRPNRAFDRLAGTATFGLLSIPAFILAVILALVLAVEIHAFPATGFTSLTTSPVQNLRSIVLPSLALTAGSIAVYFRLLRSDLISTLQEDYITMARSKGLSDRYILLRHALRPSSFSLLASAGINIGSLLTGAFVVEYLFQLPGIGYQIVESISARDYLMVQGMALVVAVAYVVVNFAVDFLIVLLDPRIRRA
ncbi:MAG: ABC transporter permease [Actinomycetota bacterium]|jgi:peptide/nickel transport system permease protein|nr:ABC transporter permease [Actinomycetota bacterium]